MSYGKLGGTYDIDSYQYPEVPKVDRVQLALNVNDLGESIAFYRKAVRHRDRQGAARLRNFAIAELPLKLILMANPGPGGSLNHLGVEVPVSSGQATPAETAQCGGTGQPEETADSRDATC